MATVSGNEVEKTDEGYAGVIHLIDDKFFFSILSPFFFFFPPPSRSNFATRALACSRDCSPSRWFIFERGVGGSRGKTGVSRRRNRRNGREMAWLNSLTRYEAAERKPGFD